MNTFLIGLYLSLGMAYVPPAPEPACRCWGLSPYDMQRYQSPYANVAVGWSTDPDKRFSLAFEARHMSSVAVNDWGTNSAEARVTWRPWR